MTASRPAIPDLNLYRRLRDRGRKREAEFQLFGSCLVDRKSTKQIGAAVTKGLNVRGDVVDRCLKPFSGQIRVRKNLRLSEEGLSRIKL